MKIAVKIMHGKNEILIEGETAAEIIDKLDDVNKIIQKLDSVLSGQKTEYKSESDEDSIESSEWKSEY